MSRQPQTEPTARPSALPAPVIERCSWATVGPLWIVRDDLLPGGTKRRVAPLILDGRPAVYAGPAEGFAQVALAYACADLGIAFHNCVAARRREHRLTAAAREAGADIIPIRPGYLSNVQAKGRALAADNGWQFLPLGLASAAIHRGLADLARGVIAQLPEPPSEIWSVAGSGVLSRALQAAAPRTPVVAVRIGRALRPGEAGRARVIEAPEDFAQPARRPPPFPSCENYDAKAWQFLDLARPGALFWNVAA